MWKRSAPTFSRQLSPRQIASKAQSLASKKLDRDEKRRRPQYHMRERVLLCNTMTEADAFLNKRTCRTNRRVLASEEDDVVGFDKPTYHHNNQHHPCIHHSPLCDNALLDQDIDNSDDDYHSSDDDDATVVAEEIHQPRKIDDDSIPTVAQAQYNNIPAAFGITTTPFPLDCRLTEDHLLTSLNSQL
ncbi:hypothetical protein BX666DRAFT_1904755 [Dichotomocladium elegans]|nr:hypothetical protein BX666DRAFT_1904755 [Dichotomocladium elegans]